MAEFNINPPDLEEDFISESDFSQHSTKSEELPTLTDIPEVVTQSVPPDDTIPTDQTEYVKPDRCSSLVSDIVMWKSLSFSLGLFVSSMIVFLAFHFNNFLCALIDLLLATFVTSALLRFYNAAAVKLNYRTYQSPFQDFLPVFLESVDREFLTQRLHQVASGCHFLHSVLNFSSPSVSFRFLVLLWIGSYLFEKVSLPIILMTATTLAMSVPVLIEKYGRYLGFLRGKLSPLLTWLCSRVGSLVTQKRTAGDSGRSKHD